jgi:GNAT superfamily N-acetyltransferase
MGTGSGYTVRRADRGDLGGLVRLHHSQENPAIPPPETPSELQVATWQQMMATPNLTIYVAEQNGEVVGTVGLTVVPNLINQCRPAAFLEPMLVAADHRRQGVGRRLVEQLLTAAREAGCHKVQLLTHKRHATDGAHAFYRSLGFTAEAEGFRLYPE